jgi:uncharacterized Zn finger protein
MIERGIKPVTAFEKTLAPWPSVCLKCGKSVSPTYANVVTKGQGGCEYCAKEDRKVDPEVAKQNMIERGVWPIADFVNTSDKWLCVCMECGEFVTPRYNSVAHKGNGGCKHCAKPDLDPSVAKAEMIGRDLWPISPYPGTNLPWLCVCMECGEFVKVRHAGVRSRGSRCKFCARKAIQPERVKAKLIARGLWPVEVIKDTHSKCLCVCMECGEFATPRIDSIIHSLQGGCTRCATSGFKLDEPAYVYLMVHPERMIAKVGVCNIGTGRIRKHERVGWDLGHPARLIRFETGRQAKAVETAAIAMWRGRGLGWGRVAGDGDQKFDGFTETVSLVRADKTVTAIDGLWADIQHAAS